MTEDSSVKDIPKHFAKKRKVGSLFGGNWLTGPFKIVRWLSESPFPALPVKEEEKG
jgi:hypothetical protein